VINFIQQKLKEYSVLSTSIALDHWILPVHHRNHTMTVKDRYQYDNISNDISILLEKGEISITPYESLTRSISSQTLLISIKDAQVIFIDGVIAIDQPYINSISTVKIFVDTNEDLRKKRFENFYKAKDMKDNEIQNLYKERIQDEYELVKKSRSKANLIIKL